MSVWVIWVNQAIVSWTSVSFTGVIRFLSTEPTWLYNTIYFSPFSHTVNGGVFHEVVSQSAIWTCRYYAARRKVECSLSKSVWRWQNFHNHKCLFLSKTTCPVRLASSGLSRYNTICSLLRVSQIVSANYVPWPLEWVILLYNRLVQWGRRSISKPSAY